jgi:hypothetical protein
MPANQEGTASEYSSSNFDLSPTIRPNDPHDPRTPPAAAKPACIFGAKYEERTQAVEDVRATPSTSRSKRRENGKKKTILGSTL